MQDRRKLNPWRLAQGTPVRERAWHRLGALGVAASLVSVIACNDTTTDQGSELNRDDEPGASCAGFDCGQLAPSYDVQLQPSDVIETPLAPDEVDATHGDNNPDVTPDETCASNTLGAALTPVNMFIMFDRSGSMQQSNKWKNASSALQVFLRDPATAGLRVALRFFGDDAPVAGCRQNDCSIDACSTPLVDIGSLTADTGVADPQEKSLTDAISSAAPHSGYGTPIYPALGGALKWAEAYRAQHADEKAVVVFVTDGEPNGCNTNMDDISQLASDAHAASEVLTYAIGLEGSNEAQMDQIARAGQTGEGIFIGASGNAELDLLDALNAIRGQTMSCDFPLPQSSTDAVSDTNKVNVTLSSESRAELELYRVSSLGECGTGEFAWYYDDVAAPTRIHLCPAACEAAVDEASSSIDVVMGCVETRTTRPPTITR